MLRFDQAGSAITRGLWRTQAVRWFLLAHGDLTLVERRLAPAGYTRRRYRLRSPLGDPAVAAGVATGGLVAGPVAGTGVIARVLNPSSLGRDSAFETAGWRADFSAAPPATVGVAAAPRIASGAHTVVPTVWIATRRRSATALGSSLALETEAITAEIGGWRTDLSPARLRTLQDDAWQMHRAVPRAQFATGYARFHATASLPAGAAVQLQTTQIGQAVRGARPVWLHRIDLAIAAGESRLHAIAMSSHYDLRGLDGRAVSDLRRADLRLERRFGVHRGVAAGLRPELTIDVATALDARRNRSSSVAGSLANLPLGRLRVTANSGWQRDEVGSATLIGAVVNAALLPRLATTVAVRRHSRRGSRVQLALEATGAVGTAALDASLQIDPRDPEQAASLTQRSSWRLGAELEAVIVRRTVAQLRGRTELPLTGDSWEVVATITTRFGRPRDAP